MLFNEKKTGERDNKQGAKNCCRAGIFVNVFNRFFFCFCIAFSLWHVFCVIDEKRKTSICLQRSKIENIFTKKTSAAYWKRSRLKRVYHSANKFIFFHFSPHIQFHKGSKEKLCHWKLHWMIQELFHSKNILFKNPLIERIQSFQGKKYYSQK